MTNGAPTARGRPTTSGGRVKINTSIAGEHDTRIDRLAELRSLTRSAVMAAVIESGLAIEEAAEIARQAAIASATRPPELIEAAV